MILVLVFLYQLDRVRPHMPAAKNDTLAELSWKKIMPCFLLCPHFADTDVIYSQYSTQLADHKTRPLTVHANPCLDPLSFILAWTWI